MNSWSATRTGDHGIESNTSCRNELPSCPFGSDVAVRGYYCRLRRIKPYQRAYDCLGLANVAQQT